MKRILALFSLLILVVFIFTGCGGQKTSDASKDGAKAQDQQVIKLKMGDHMPVSHFLSSAIAKDYIDRVEKISNGKVKIDYYPAEQLGKQKDMLNLVNQGMIDIGFVTPSFLAGQLPLNTVMMLPSYSTAAEGSEIYQRLAYGVLIDEFKKYNARPVFVYALPQYNVGTSKKPVNTIADLKGLKMKTSGGLYDKMAELVGMIPVVVTSNELYESMQRGIVDGALHYFIGVKGYRLQELEKYHTAGASFGGFPCAYIINEKKWQQLPQDVQKILLQAGQESNKFAGQAIDKQEQELIKEFEKGGMKIKNLTPEEKKQWKEPFKDIATLWIDDVEKKGASGKKIYDEFEKVCKEVVK